jgi:glycosyltransferase involved in cell wall biosynthesis/SAM-dependent methyltransferase
MSDQFSIVAIIAARNEADIIGQVVDDLIRQRLSVYFLDDCSTDGTLAAVEPYLGRGVIQIENLGQTLGRSAASPFDWERILLRKAQIASELDADWFIHHDADEFRESPWFGLILKDAIQQVDAAGFNAIDFASFDFWPTHDRFKAGDDVREAFTRYAPSEIYDRVQIRCWKKTAKTVDLASTGGHEARFEGRKVFPLRFILRHYPIRGQAHGEQKVFRERRERFVATERERGWHVQYNNLPEGASFIRDPASLIPYDPFTIRLELMLHHRGVEDLESQVRAFELTREALASLRREHAAREDEVASLRRQLDASAQICGRQQQELDCARRLADDRRLEIDRLRTAWQERSRQLDEVYASKSWRITAPLRTVVSLATGLPEPSSAVDRDGAPAETGVNWGDLARVSPFSATWGTDRGLPIDRHYIHQFLDRHKADIRGRVLEVKDANYAKMFGESRVQHVDVLDIDRNNPQATLIHDLARADAIAADQFDCLILTQTLHIIYDIKSALHHAARVLKPGGVLLCTIPAVSRVNYENGGLESGDFWRLTGAAAQRLFADVFGSENITVETHGNVRVCAAFLYGLAAHEVSPEDLSFQDPWFPLIHCVRAVRSKSSALK